MPEEVGSNVPLGFSGGSAREGGRLVIRGKKLASYWTRDCPWFVRTTGTAIPTAMAATIKKQVATSASVSVRRPVEAAVPACTISRVPMTARKAKAPGIIATTPGNAKVTAGARKYREKPCASNPTARAPIKVPLIRSIPRWTQNVRIVWLAAPHKTLAHATRVGTLNRKR
jgi:hypothetical protein